MKSMEWNSKASRNRKLLEKSVRSVAHRFGVGTGGTRFAVVLT